jgi:hypothetical protein
VCRFQRSGEGQASPVQEASVSVVTPAVATLWVGWTLKLSFGDSGSYFKKIQVVFSIIILYSTNKI